MSSAVILKERAAITTSTLTRDFKHLLAPTKLVGYGVSRDTRNPRPGVPVQDRIKQWNIVPGDKVRIINGPDADKDAVRQVTSINKLTNKVYVNGLPSKGKKASEPRARPQHYSNLQLLVGQYEVPQTEGAAPSVQNVWATRLSTSKPFYIKQHGVWTWNRYAAATSIVLPSAPGTEMVPARKNRIRIAWPKPKKEDKPAKAGLYDTLPEDALAVTWSPLHPKVAIDLATLEHHYIRSLHPGKSFFNPTPRRSDSHQDEYASIEEVDPHMPMEQFLAAELSNPHSRAKKQARWQEREQSKVALKEEFVTREIERARRTGPGRELGGRRVTPSEARRIGEWKWKNELLRLATQEKHRRWAAGGGEETKKRRQERGARKVRRTHERLRQLVLPEAKNQVVPPTVAGQRRT